MLFDALTILPNNLREKKEEKLFLETLFV